MPHTPPNRHATTPDPAGHRRTPPGQPDITATTPGDGPALQRMPPGRRAELRAMFGADAERAAGILQGLAFGKLDTAADRD